MATMMWWCWCNAGCTIRPAIDALRHEVSAVVHRSAGVECKVVMVPPKSLPFTSSGKLSRAGAKQKYLSGEIAEIALTAEPALPRSRAVAPAGDRRPYRRP